MSHRNSRCLVQEHQKSCRKSQHHAETAAIDRRFQFAELVQSYLRSIKIFKKEIILERQRLPCAAAGH
jgi:hypothetical protein